MGNRSNEKIAMSVPSQQPEANAFVTIQYASIRTQAMEEHKGRTMQENMKRLRIIHWQACQQQHLSFFIKQKMSAN